MLTVYAPSQGAFVKKKIKKSFRIVREIVVV
jgi:hypothetical protein